MHEIDTNATQNINYQKSFVAFLDVLGFKKLVYSQDSRDKEKLKRYFGIVNEAIKYLKKIPSKSDIGSIIISDAIILSVPQQSVQEDNIDRLRHLCVAVGLIQLHLALKNIWVRGAISSGDAYFNPINNQIVGPAYINSYMLESNLANSPRVILDSKIIDELNFPSSAEFIDDINKSEEGGPSYDNWGNSILFRWNFPDGKPVTTIENDVPLFIDYLSPIVENGDNELIQLIENLENVIYKETNVYKKFRWVVDYLKATFHRAGKNDISIPGEASYRLNNL